MPSGRYEKKKKTQCENHEKERLGHFDRIKLSLHSLGAGPLESVAVTTQGHPPWKYHIAYNAKIPTFQDMEHTITDLD